MRRRRTSSAWLTSVARLFALALPVLGVALILQRMVTSMGKKAWALERGQRRRAGRS